MDNAQYSQIRFRVRDGGEIFLSTSNSMSLMVAENIRFIRLNIQGVFLAGPHPCLAANLRLGIYNGETFFDR